MATVNDVQLILLGESGVGKTSLMMRFVSGTFKESLQRTRIDYSKKVIKIKDKEVSLTVWDTSGQEMYNSLVRSYYNLADGVLLVYDVQNASTFMTLSKWLVDLKSKNEKAQVLIAGNKIEDRSKKSVTVPMVSGFAKSERLEHVGVSAKSGENVEILFHHLVKKILASRGILTFSKDRLLEKLEKFGDYLSPWTVVEEQPPKSPGIDPVDNTANESTHLSRRVGNGGPIIKDLDAGGIWPGSGANECRRTIGNQELTEISSFHDSSNEDRETASTGSADSALEFFGGDDFPEDRSDVVKLHETPPDIPAAQSGKKLAYDLYPPAGVEGALDKSPVILLHGRLDSRKTWKKFGPRISEMTGRKVFALDARNHGESPWSDEMDFEVLVNDLEEFMVQEGIRKAVLVGHSMGGKLAIMFALRKPDKVEKLIVEDMVAEGYSPKIKGTVGQILTLLRKSLDAIPPNCDEMAAKNAVFEYVKSFTPPGSTSGFMFDAETLALKKTGSGYAWQANLDVLEDMLKNRSSPTLTGVYGGEALFLYGSESFFEVDKDESIAKYFPRSRKVCVEGAGHLVHQDCPDVFLKEVLDFI